MTLSTRVLSAVFVLAWVVFPADADAQVSARVSLGNSRLGHGIWNNHVGGVFPSHPIHRPIYPTFPVSPFYEVYWFDDPFRYQPRNVYNINVQPPMRPDAEPPVAQQPPAPRERPLVLEWNSKTGRSERREYPLLTPPGEESPSQETILEPPLKTPKKKDLPGLIPSGD